MSVKFRGIYTVVCTPFTDDDKIDEPALRKHISSLIEKGKVHGLIPNGSTGEFAAMTEIERKQVADIVIDEAAGRVPVVVGTASVSTSKTIMYTQYAQNAGADGVMIVPSYYCHPNPEEIYGHYKAIAENTDIPIIVYNNPGTSGVDMAPELIARLAEFDQMSHVKESSGDMTRLAEIQRLCGDKMDVFCGCDTLSLEMFMMGAVGWIVPAGNIIPNILVDLYDLAVVKKDFVKAKENYFKLLPLITMFETTGQYIQLSKAGLNMLGTSYGTPRRPLLPPTEELQAKLKEMLDSLV